MNFQTSDHLKEYKFLNVEILTTPGNCTSYIIRQTQGGEYGDEAENVRAIFEAAINKAFGNKQIEIEAECEDCDWKGAKDDMEIAETDDDVDVCPLCGSEKIYYHK